MELAQEVGERLRRLRQDGGLSLSELARRSGVGKGTLSELETGQRNPTLETLYALTTALEAPLSMVVGPAPVQGAAVHAVLTDRVQDAAAVSEVYRIRIQSGAVQRSAAHVRGAEEHLLVFSGTARVGPASAPFEVGPAATPGGRRMYRISTRRWGGMWRGCWWCATRWNEMPTPHRPAPGHDHRRSAVGSTAAAGGRQYPVRRPGSDGRSDKGRNSQACRCHWVAISCKASYVIERQDDPSTCLYV